jgi:hypothetical protein
MTHVKLLIFGIPLSLLAAGGASAAPRLDTPNKSAI